MQRRLAAVGGTVALLAVVALPGATLPGDEARPGAPATQDPGEAVFKGKGLCSTCHGPAAKGTPLAPDLTDDTWLQFDERPTVEGLVAMIRKGVPTPLEHPAPMPPMGGARLSDEELTAVARYVLSLSPPPGR